MNTLSVCRFLTLFVLLTTYLLLVPTHSYGCANELEQIGRFGQKLPTMKALKAMSKRQLQAQSIEALGLSGRTLNGANSLITVPQWPIRIRDLLKVNFYRGFDNGAFRFVPRNFGIGSMREVGEKLRELGLESPGYQDFLNDVQRQQDRNSVDWSVPASVKTLKTDQRLALSIDKLGFDPRMISMFRGAGLSTVADLKALVDKLNSGGVAPMNIGPLYQKVIRSRVKALSE